jgi:hypothetical protein
MSEKKSNKKMSAARTVKIKKMSARVSNWLYLKSKFIADAQGLTMEQKITELLKKDIAYVSNQKWFIEYLREDDNQDFSTFGVLPSKRNSKDKSDQESGASHSDFDANYLGDEDGLE